MKPQLDNTVHHEIENERTEALDSVCGMAVTTESEYHHVQDGQTYYFCSVNCPDKYRSDPQRYLSPAHDSSYVSIPNISAGDYICTMHPEVRQSGPGTCPHCGTALKLETPVLNPTRTQYTCPMHSEIVRDEPGDCPKFTASPLPAIHSRAGFWLLSSAWKVPYVAQCSQILASSSAYARIRHLQYASFVLIMVGFFWQWPTLVTLGMFLVLVFMYMHLAKRKERDALAAFGGSYRVYMRNVPAFIPNLASVNPARSHLPPYSQSRGE